jgi:hypothetical protein
MVLDIEALKEGDYCNLLALPSTIAEFIGQAKKFEQQISRDISVFKSESTLPNIKQWGDRRYNRGNKTVSDSLIYFTRLTKH